MNKTNLRKEDNYKVTCQEPEQEPKVLGSFTLY